MTYIDVSRYRFVLCGYHYFHISVDNTDREFDTWWVKVLKIFIKWPSV